MHGLILESHTLAGIVIFENNTLRYLRTCGKANYIGKNVIVEYDKRTSCSTAANNKQCHNLGHSYCQYLDKSQTSHNYNQFSKKLVKNKTAVESRLVHYQCTFYL